MNKFLLTAVVSILFIQNTFAASISTVDLNEEFSSPILRRTSFGPSFNSINDRREYSLKRPREEKFESVSPDRRTPPKRADSIPRPAGTMFEFSDAHKNALRQSGISELQINRIELLQTALFRSPHGDSLDPRSYLSEQEFEDVCKKIGSEDVRILVFTLKSLYDKKIPLSRITPNIVYSPAVRLSCLDRSDPKANEISTRFAVCPEIRIQSINGLTFIEDETPETPEERAERHALKAKLFSILESQRGISETNRATELNEADQIWSDYFKYIQIRINHIEMNNAHKIKSIEIEETFKEFVAKKYSTIRVGDADVYFRKEEVDLCRRNDAKTNEQLLAEGLAPIGADGEPMELHHLTRRHPGTIVLMTQAFHHNHSALLHIRSEKHMRQPQPVDRSVFASWKKIAFSAIKKALSSTEENEFDPAVKLFSETDPLSQDEATT